MVVQREWTLQRSCAAFLSKALPADAYFTSIDMGRSTSAAQGQLRKLRGVRAGVPDMLVVYAGKTLWCELKVDTALSAAQIVTRDALRANGHVWELCRSPEDVEAACNTAGIPLRATLGDIRTRIAEQNERLPAKAKRVSQRKAVPRNSMTAAQYHKAHGEGFL
jgi:hypothetical protein